MMKHTVAIIVFFVFVFLSQATQAQSNIKDYLTKGNAYYASKKYKSAAVCYKQACILDTNSFDAWYNFGASLYKLEKYVSAKEAFEKSITKTSDSTKRCLAYHNLGNALLKQQKYAKAISYYSKALRINPKDAETRYNLAYAQQLLKKEENAKKDDKKNQPKQPEPSSFAKKIKAQADTFVAENKFEEALRLMKTAKQKDKTIELYKEYIQKLEEIAPLFPSKKEENNKNKTNPKITPSSGGVQI